MPRSLIVTVHRTTAAGLFRVVLCPLVFAFVACVAPKGSDPSNPAVSVQTARAADVQQRRMVPVNSFSSRDRIAVVIRNLTSHDQVLQVELARHDSGLILWKNAITIPRARSYATGPTAPLPAGNYSIKASGTGIQPVIHGFTVYGY